MRMLWADPTLFDVEVQLSRLHSTGRNDPVGPPAVVTRPFDSAWRCSQKRE